MSQEQEKKLAAETAAALVQEGMIIGLGTGSTAAFAIQKLGARIREGLHIQCVPTSEWTAQRAREENIPLIDFSQTTHIDLTLDGADEFDADLNLIKGGGGALFREKIVAAASQQLVIFADATKRVARLGRFPLPVEVNPYGWQVVAERITRLGARVTLRQKDGKPFISDNHGLILDCAFGEIPDPPTLEEKLKHVVGVMETGLFVGMANRIILAEGTSVWHLTR